MIAPDETTFAYLKGRPYAPKGAQWDEAVAFWRTLPSDPGATFDVEVNLDAAELAPMVTWGNSPEEAAPVTAVIPDPAGIADAKQQAAMRETLEYMGLTPGMRIVDVAVDQVFIGSCTNARIESSEERRVGKEGVSTCRSRRAP